MASSTIERCLSCRYRRTSADVSTYRLTASLTSLTSHLREDTVEAHVDGGVDGVRGGRAIEASGWLDEAGGGQIRERWGT